MIKKKSVLIISQFIFMKYDIKIYMLIISYFILIMIDVKIYVLIIS